MSIVENTKKIFKHIFPRKGKGFFNISADIYKLTPGGFLYIIQLGDTDIFKIGISVDPEKRLKQLQSKCPIPLEIIFVNFGHDYKITERLLHDQFKDQRVKGEWFKLSVKDIVWIIHKLPIQDNPCKLHAG